MSSRTMQEQKSREILMKYLEKPDVVDYLAFAGRFDEFSGRTLDSWVKCAKNYLSQEDYEKFYARVFPLDADTPENEELKDRLVSVARRISMGRAGIYDVIEELDMSMERYIYLLRQLTYRHKVLNASCYRSNGDYYNNLASYTKPANLTSSFPTLGKDMHNKLVEFVEEHNLPLNNYTYTEAYKAFKMRGIITFNKVNK